MSTRYVPLVVALVVDVAVVRDVNEYFVWMHRPQLLNARQPAVDPADFDTWMNAQFADIRAGHGGFNVDQWRDNRAIILTRAGQELSAPPTAPAATSEGLGGPLIPLNQGRGAATASIGLTIGTGATTLKNPGGVAVDAAGNIFVADPDSARVLEFDSGGALVRQIGAQGDAEGQLQQPFDLAVDGQGELYVLDNQRSAILRFDANGEYRGTLLAGMGAYSPRAIALGKNGHIFVADTGSSRIVELSQDNVLVRAISSLPGDIPLEQPTGVAVDAALNLYVALPGQKRLVKLGPDDQLLAQRELDPSNTRDGPHLAFTPRGELIVTEAGGARVSMLDTNLSRIAVLADKSTGIERPVGVAADAQGRVYVSDTAKAAVLRLDPPRS